MHAGLSKTKKLGLKIDHFAFETKIHFHLQNATAFRRQEMGGLTCSAQLYTDRPFSHTPSYFTTHTHTHTLTRIFRHARRHTHSHKHTNSFTRTNTHLYAYSDTFFHRYSHIFFGNSGSHFVAQITSVKPNSFSLSGTLILPK